VVVPGGDAGAIASAAGRLRAGGLVAFPTETVYGLGADAGNDAAVEAIYRIKGRPASHPVIVHVPADTDLSAWASEVPRVAQALIERYWPGPLTLILHRAAGVGARVSAGQESIGLRSPDHPIAQALLEEFCAGVSKRGIAAPSANRFGRISPTTAGHVREEFGDELMILDGGPCRVGIESTILDLSRYRTLGAVLLRPGGISAMALAELLGAPPRSPDASAPRVAGSLAAHYAPRTTLRLCDAAALRDVPESVAVWAFGDAPTARALPWRVAPDDAARYAHELYATLRELDASGATEIWVESPPDVPAWTAILDRLSRAQSGSGAVSPDPL
jgi:L-threonylcarbamoyladenylate synthase